MSQPEPEYGSPTWWLKTLKARLDKRQAALTLYDDYYSGKQTLAFASTKFTEAFGALFKNFADNWMELIINAVEERLNVEGFRIGKDTSADQSAWDIWQRNQLDADSQIAHMEALIHGESYALVWADDLGDPAITIEHPSQMIVAYEAGSMRKRTAALKCWDEDDGTKMATLYLPDTIYKFQARKASFGATVQWEPRKNADEWLDNPLDVVPVVPLVNRPRLLKGGESEIHQAIPLQDAVNKLVVDMLVASEFASFRQRWLTGMSIPKDPQTGQPIETFKAAVDRLWVAPPVKKDQHPAQFGEFEATDLDNYVTAVETIVQHVASQTRTPPHYFYLRGSFPSGESLKAAETGLIAKARRKMRYFGESWEEVIRLAFLVGSDSRGETMKSETIWRDPESRSESEHIDAVVKQKALNIPDEALWEKAGFTPVEIDRFKKMREDLPPASPGPQPPVPVEPEVKSGEVVTTQA